MNICRFLMNAPVMERFVQGEDEAPEHIPALPEKGEAMEKGPGEQFSMTEPGADGSFHLNVDFPDSTTFVFQALTKRNMKNIYLEVWKDSLRLPEEEVFLAERQALPGKREAAESLALPPVSGDGISAKNYY